MPEGRCSTLTAVCHACTWLHVYAGWYARIAQQLPPHVELARMAAVALSMAQNVNRGGLSSLQEQVRRL